MRRYRHEFNHRVTAIFLDKATRENRAKVTNCNFGLVQRKYESLRIPLTFNWLLNFADFPSNGAHLQSKGYRP